MYFAHEQIRWDQLSTWVMVRGSSGDARDLVESVRAAVWSVDEDVPITGIDELAAVLGRSTRTTRFLTLLLGGFGVLALGLGAIGVFGVTAYTVGRRIPEFGVRVALGSSRLGVVRTALLGGVAPVLAGLAAGVLVALWTGPLLESALFGVEPADPFTLGGVTALLGGVALVAMLVPAWRASGVDPREALVGE